MTATILIPVTTHGTTCPLPVPSRGETPDTQRQAERRNDLLQPVLSSEQTIPLRAGA